MASPNSDARDKEPAPCRISDRPSSSLFASGSTENPPHNSSAREWEMMRRIRELVAAGKLKTTDDLVFKHKSTTFIARVRSDGSIVSNPSANRPNPMIFDSPTNFVNEMALSTLDPSQRPRAGIFLNGWNECLVNGRPLCSLRSEMYLEKDSNTPVRHSSHDKANVHLSNTDSHFRHSSPHRMSRKHSTPPGPTTVRGSQPSSSLHDSKPSHASQSPQSPQSLRTPVKSSKVGGDRPRTPLSPRISRNFPASSQVEQNLDTSQPHPQPRRMSDDNDDCLSDRRLHKKDHERDATTSGVPKYGASGRKGSDVKEQAKGKQKESDPPGRPDSPRPSNRVDVEGGGQKGGLGSTPNGEKSNRKMSQQGNTEAKKKSSELKSKMKDVDRNTGNASSAERNDTRTGGHASSGRGVSVGKADKPSVRAQGDESIDSKSDRMAFVKSSASDGGYDNRINSGARSNIKEEDKDVMMDIEADSPISAVKSRSGKEERRDVSTEGKLKEEPGESGSRNMASSTSNWTARQLASGKRKTMDTFGDDTGALRYKRIRRECNKGSGGWEHSPISRRTEKLDPDTMEAVAVAERAEKEEESRRGRRTTRLAAGKIKQVDYNVSSSAVLGRGSGGEKDDDDDNDDDDDEGGGNNAGNEDGSSRRGMRDSKKNEKMTIRGNGSGSGTSSYSNDVYKSNRKRDTLDDVGVATRVKGSKRMPGKSGNNVEGCDVSERRRLDKSGFDDEIDCLNEAGMNEKDVVTVKSVGCGKPVEMCTAALKVEREQTEVLLEDRRDAMGWTIEQLMCIGECVKSCNSVNIGKIIDTLKRRKERVIDDRRSGDVRRYLERALKSLRGFSRELEVDSKEIESKQLLAFICGDIRRLETGGLRTGYPRRPLAILQVVEEEEQDKVTIQKDVKKMQRESEEIRLNLESEIDSRRKAELEANIVEIQCLGVMASIERETEKQKKFKVELDWMEKCDLKTGQLVKETRNLILKLRGEQMDVDDESEVLKKDVKVEVEVGGNTRAAAARSSGGQNCHTPGEKRGRGLRNGGMEVSSDMLEKRRKRMHEMDRLRWLIATKEAECERYQRICERERMQAVGYEEEKNRLEKELYGFSVAKRGGVGGNSSGANLLKEVAEPAVTTAKVVMRGGKDGGGKEGNGRKDELRWVGGNHSNKGTWISGRGKGHNSGNGGKGGVGPAKAGSSGFEARTQQVGQTHHRASSNKGASWTKANKTSNTGGGKTSGGEGKHAKRKGGGNGGGSKHQSGNAKSGA